MSGKIITHLSMETYIASHTLSKKLTKIEGFQEDYVSLFPLNLILYMGFVKNNPMGVVYIYFVSMINLKLFVVTSFA